MLHYTPIDIGFPFICGHSDLLCFDWQNRTAEFTHPNDNDLSVCIRFEANVIVRMLDEFPLSTETDPKDWSGLVPDHFAYRVVGDAFLEQQSDAWRFVNGPINHFRFMTGWGCLDVLTPGEPNFWVRPRRNQTAAIN